jgi:hypothetical protein
MFLSGTPASAATAPTITKIYPTSGHYSITTPSGRVTITPFSGYTGRIWARKINFGTNGKVYMFVPREAYTAGEVVLYDGNGEEISRLLAFGTGTFHGFNPSIVVDRSNKRVYFAVARNAVSASARILRVRPTGLTTMNSVTAVGTSDKGNVLVQFLKPSDRRHPILVTMIASNRSTMKIWKYNETHGQYVRDTVFNTSRIRVEGSTITLR